MQRKPQPHVHSVLVSLKPQKSTIKLFGAHLCSWTAVQSATSTGRRDATALPAPLHVLVSLHAQTAPEGDSAFFHQASLVQECQG